MVESPDCNFKNNFMKSILFHISLRDHSGSTVSGEDPVKQQKPGQGET